MKYIVVEMHDLVGEECSFKEFESKKEAEKAVLESLENGKFVVVAKKLQCNITIKD